MHRAGDDGGSRVGRTQLYPPSYHGAWRRVAWARGPCHAHAFRQEPLINMDGERHGARDRDKRTGTPTASASTHGSKNAVEGRAAHGERLHHQSLPVPSTGSRDALVKITPAVTRETGLSSRNATADRSRREKRDQNGSISANSPVRRQYHRARHKHGREGSM